MNLLPEQLIELGFTEFRDPSNDPWCTTWDLRTKHFLITFDCALDVTVFRLDAGGVMASDGIKVVIDGPHDVQALIDWAA